MNRTTSTDTAASARDIVLDVSQLTKLFSGRNAVDGVSFQIARGSVFGLIGPNGAGKTTLIRALLGLISATSGRAAIAGSDIQSHIEEVRRKVHAAARRP